MIFSNSDHIYISGLTNAVKRNIGSGQNQKWLEIRRLPRQCRVALNIGLDCHVILGSLPAEGASTYLPELFRSGLDALKEDYVALHMVTCLIPAFRLAGAMVTVLGTFAGWFTGNFIFS
jgi:hypothetical protein